MSTGAFQQSETNQPLKKELVDDKRSFCDTIAPGRRTVAENLRPKMGPAFHLGV